MTSDGRTGSGIKSVASNTLNAWPRLMPKRGSKSTRVDSIAVILLLAVSGAAWATPKARTVKELIALTLEKGGDKTLKEPMSSNLGFTAPPKTRAISYSFKYTPDHREHQFYIVLSEKGNPAELIWGNTLITEKKDVQYVDAYKFRTSLDGKLRTALHNVGKAGEIVQEKLDIKARSTMKAYKREQTFLLQDAISLD